MGKSVEYLVTIKGRAWSGFVASMELKFYSKPTLAMVQTKAGDFEHYSIISSLKVTTTDTVEKFEVS